MTLTQFLYVVLLFWFGFMFKNAFIASKGESRKETIPLWIGFGIAIVAFAINVIYTGLLGWNAIAHTTLEWTLDIINGIFIVIGLMIYRVQMEILKDNKKQRTQAVDEHIKRTNI